MRGQPRYPLGTSSAEPPTAAAHHSPHRHGVREPFSQDLASQWLGQAVRKFEGLEGLVGQGFRAQVVGIGQFGEPLVELRWAVGGVEGEPVVVAAGDFGAAETEGVGEGGVGFEAGEGPPAGAVLGAELEGGAVGLEPGVAFADLGELGAGSASQELVATRPEQDAFLGLAELEAPAARLISAATVGCPASQARRPSARSGRPSAWAWR